MNHFTECANMHLWNTSKSSVCVLFSSVPSILRERAHMMMGDTLILLLHLNKEKSVPLICGRFQLELAFVLLLKTQYLKNVSIERSGKRSVSALYSCKLRQNKVGEYRKGIAAR